MPTGARHICMGWQAEGVKGCAGGGCAGGCLQHPCVPRAGSRRAALALPRAPAPAPVTQLPKVAGWRLGLRPSCLLLLLIVLIIAQREHRVPSIWGQGRACCLFRCVVPKLRLSPVENAQAPSAPLPPRLCLRAQAVTPGGESSLSPAPSRPLP